MSTSNATFLMRSSVLAVLATAAGAAGQVSPSWAVPTPIQVVVPAGGSSSFNAPGDVTVAFDAVLVFDSSGSMASNAGQVAPNGGNAIGDWGFAGANALFDGLPDQIRMGLTEFDTNANTVVSIDTLGSLSPLSSHRQALRDGLSTIDRNGGTNIANAIDQATGLLTDPSNNAESKHLVIVTDGETNNGLSVVLQAVDDALLDGINTVNTIGLPGARLTDLEEIATRGDGEFADATDLSTLVDAFAGILGSAETLEQLDILLPGGGVLTDVPVSDAGDFLVSLDVIEGDNLFIARTLDSDGDIRTAELLIEGVVVPEPASAAVGLVAAGLLLRRRQ